jgi:hypothetical protein
VRAHGRELALERPRDVDEVVLPTNGNAAITGDFVLIDKEVNAVARTLRQHGIDVTALHNHGLMETPRLFYVHFWANDDPVKLARALKAALGQTNSATSR